MTRPDYTAVPPADVIGAAELPPLPRPSATTSINGKVIVQYFTAQQVRAYAIAALAEGATPTAAQAAGRSVADLDEARAAGRAEAVEILSGLCAETGIDDYIGWSNPVGPEDEGAAYWKADKLRDLFKVDDKLHNMLDRAEAMYWQAKGEKDEAERMMRMVERAPLFQPLHDYLAKQQSVEAWDLMGALQREAPAEAKSATSVATNVAKDAGHGDLIDLLRAAYLEGFNISCGHCNSESPFDDYSNSPESDSDWVSNREAYLRSLVQDVSMDEVKAVPASLPDPEEKSSETCAKSID